jgi:dTDP-D-glucose 4,6-dehydratase
VKQKLSAAIRSMEENDVLSVPISPTRIFVAANNRAPLESLNRSPSKDTVRTANHNVVRIAVDEVYGSTKSRREFVEKRLRKPNEQPLPGLVMGPG